MRDNQDIKDQLKKIKNLINESNPVVKSHVSEIKQKYLIKEDIETPANIAKRYNVPTSVEDDIEDDTEKKNDAEQAYRISGGVLVIHGDTKKDTELTTDDKIAFQETMDEFVEEVSDLVDFETLNVYKNSVEWSGKLIDQDLEFIFTIGEDSGIYINGEMIKVDSEFLDLINKLQQFYQKFKSKWGRVLASRKKTMESPV
jgi:hypothetical protein